MPKKIRLTLLGITYNQIESGVYALILKQVGGNRRIPIIIGFPEAQAIECRLQGIETPRPLTHDMAAGILTAFGIRLKEVYIYQLPNGVFAGSMRLTDGLSEQEIDARSSDAIAMAIRCNAPIYTDEEMLEKAGFEHNEDADGDTTSSKIESQQVIPIEEATDEMLESTLETLVQEERYEEAAQVKEILEERRKERETEQTDNTDEDTDPNTP